MAVALAGPALAQRSAAVGAPVPARIGVVHPGADHLGSTVRDRFPAARLTPQRVLAAPPQATAGGSAPYGMDVSSYQGNVDWGSAAAGGATFAYVKASEATGYLNPYFRSQYDGSYAAGLIQGAYHFALPNDSSGAAPALPKPITSSPTAAAGCPTGTPCLRCLTLSTTPTARAAMA
jgi:lysozyme